MRTIAIVFVLFAILVCGTAVAQSYDYRQGYIFEQTYVKRITLSKAEQLIGTPEFFTPYRENKWGKEKISSNQVKRSGAKLTIKFLGKAPLKLRDFNIKTTRERDGDFQRFQYLGNAAKFHLIGVEFGHDQPTFLLVDQAGQEIYFVDMD